MSAQADAARPRSGMQNLEGHTSSKMPCEVHKKNTKKKRIIIIIKYNLQSTFSKVRILVPFLPLKDAY